MSDINNVLHITIINKKIVSVSTAHLEITVDDLTPNAQTSDDLISINLFMAYFTIITCVLSGTLMLEVEETSKEVALERLIKLLAAAIITGGTWNGLIQANTKKSIFSTEFNDNDTNKFLKNGRNYKFITPVLITLLSLTLSAAYQHNDSQQGTKNFSLELLPTTIFWLGLHGCNIMNQERSLPN